jgi:hypothetical protein
MSGQPKLLSSALSAVPYSIRFLRTQLRSQTIPLPLCLDQHVNKNLTVGHTRSLDTDALNAEEDA